MRLHDGRRSSPGVDAVLLQILRTLSDAREVGSFLHFHIERFSAQYSQSGQPQDHATWPEFASLARRLTERFAGMKGRSPEVANAINALNTWADLLNRAIAAEEKQQTRSRAKSPARTVVKRAIEKGSRGGKQA